MAAEAAHVAAAADCLHTVRGAITSTAVEISAGNYPKCDFNPVGGVFHNAIGRSNTFTYCVSCFATMCKDCDLTRALLIPFMNINGISSIISYKYKGAPVLK